MPVFIIKKSVFKLNLHKYIFIYVEFLLWIYKHKKRYLGKIFLSFYKLIQTNFPSSKSGKNVKVKLYNFIVFIIVVYVLITSINFTTLYCIKLWKFIPKFYLYFLIFLYLLIFVSLIISDKFIKLFNFLFYSKLLTK